MITFLAYFLYGAVRLLGMTYRFTHVYRERTQGKNKAHILATWHQNIIGSMLAQMGRNYQILVSRSKDGELAAVSGRLMGHVPVRGSSHKGGTKAKHEVIKNLMQHQLPVGITVDGPKGPRKIPKKGAIEIARQAQCPIIPYIPYPKRYWTLQKSWDLFRFPYPFTTITAYYGEPIWIPLETRYEDFEKYQQILSKALEDLECLAYLESKN